MTASCRRTSRSLGSSTCIAVANRTQVKARRIAAGSFIRNHFHIPEQRLQVPLRDKNKPLSARLKSCPDTKRMRVRLYSSHSFANGRRKGGAPSVIPDSPYEPRLRRASRGATSLPEHSRDRV